MEPTAPQSPTQPSVRSGVRLAIPAHNVRWAYVLLALNGLAFLVATVLGGSTNPTVLVILGAKYNALIAQGQYWRLLSANFLHVGFLHLLFNGYALYIFGRQVESRFGALRFMALYLLSGIGGTVASFLGNAQLSAGASGAILGLTGASVVYFATYRSEFGALGRRHLTNLLIVVAYNLIFGLVQPRIDNWGHLGGLTCGLLLGWAFCPRYAAVPSQSAPGVRLVDKYPKWRAGLATLGLVILLTILVRTGAQSYRRDRLSKAPSAIIYTDSYAREGVKYHGHTFSCSSRHLLSGHG